MSILEVFETPPSTNLMDVISSEYSFNSAFADLIDNCIDGKADDIRIHFEFSKNKYSVYIPDNGTGMSKSQLKEAAVIGFKSSEELRNSNALGRDVAFLK